MQYSFSGENFKVIKYFRPKTLRFQTEFLTRGSQKSETINKRISTEHLKWLLEVVVMVGTLDLFVTHSIVPLLNHVSIIRDLIVAATNTRCNKLKIKFYDGLYFSLTDIEKLLQVNDEDFFLICFNY